MCNCYNLPKQMFLIPCDNWKTLFLKSLSLPWGLFNCHFLALFEANDLKEARFLFFYFHKKNSMLIPTWKVAKKVSKLGSCISYMLYFLYMLNFFLYKWYAFKELKISLEACFSMIFFIFTRSLYRMRTKSQSTWLHIH